jgi:hypothetical protein
VRFRGWILLLLIAHVFGHPMVHAMCATPAPAHGALASLPSDANSLASSLENCDLCRAGQGSMLWAGLPDAERLNLHWIAVRLQAVSYASLRIERHLPARAPPSL